MAKGTYSWAGVLERHHVMVRTANKGPGACIPDLSLLLTSWVTFDKCLCPLISFLFIFCNPGEDYIHICGSLINRALTWYQYSHSCILSITSYRMPARYRPVLEVQNVQRQTRSLPSRSSCSVKPVSKLQGRVINRTISELCQCCEEESKRGL